MLWLGWLSWLEHRPVNQKVADSTPGQGTCLGCGFSPWSGCVWEATNPCFCLNRCFSSFLSPSLPLSLKSISMFSNEDKKKLLWYVHVTENYTAVKKTKNHYMDKLRNKVEIKSMSPNIIHTICVHLYKFKTRKPKK